MISIIVPVYNAEKNLSRCLNSICRQTFHDFELIIVNDGSTDHSLDICEQYARTDARFHILSQKNSGVSAARNKGLSAVKGDYISFIDSDDYVENDYLERLVQGIQKFDADLCYCSAFDELPDGSLTNNKIQNGNILLKASDYKWNSQLEHSVVWGGVYKREIIEGLRFDEGIQVGEDSLFFAQCIKKSKLLYYVGDRLYHYIYYSDSAMRGSFNSMKMTELSAWKKICELFDYSVDSMAAYAMMNIAGYFEPPVRPSRTTVPVGVEP
jgi:glycosyltransferase involved in cell wall biosynthesis